MARLPGYQIPEGCETCWIEFHGRKLRLSNLSKTFWPELGLSKRHLLQYYIDVSTALLPHLHSRPMVMKRYPNGITGDFFFMKRTPSHRPEWLRTCSIRHRSGSVIDFPVVEDLPSLLWIVNLGCIDLNPWYSRCEDTDRPDFVVFDLDPVEGATFAMLRRAALMVRDALAALRISAFAKTSGSRGIHIYASIQRGPVQKEVWRFAKQFAKTMESLHPKLITAEYRVAQRPKDRVLLDYNQNAWGRTLASVYSVRPREKATVSAPVTWAEIDENIRLEDFHISNTAQRLEQVGDLWKDALDPEKKINLQEVLENLHAFTL